MRPLTDIHSHHFPLALVEALSARSEPPCIRDEDGAPYVYYGPDKRYPLKGSMSDIDSKLMAMDRAGLDFAVLSVTMPGVDGIGTGADEAAAAANDELAATCASLEDRLAWLAVLPMDDPRGADAELRRAVELGARGAAIFSNVSGRPLDLAAHSGVFAAACELDVPILVHPTYPLAADTVGEYQLTSTLGYLFDTTTAVLRLVLDGIYDRYPGLKLILAHAGSLIPYIVGRIDFQATQRPGGMGALSVPPSEHLRRLYVDSVCLWPPALRLAVEFFGAERVALGTDHPQWPIADSLEAVGDAGMDGRTRALIECGTARALFKL